MPREIFHITSAGSVDDGKSTILARLLLDTGSVFDDQLGGVDPKKVDATTIADLLDGLDSEREQGITIDVAHRFFDSDTRRYHIADSPGHEQYTRNMATAASHADALLLVVDARVGVKPQTVTHFEIARKLGLRRLVVAVNKMDLVEFKKRVFVDISQQVTDLVGSTDLEALSIIPVSGLSGDNVVRPTKRMSWWRGETILASLDQMTRPARNGDDTVVGIQYVQRLAGGGRRYLGSLHGGSLAVGDTLHSPRYPHKEFTVLSVIHSATEVSGVSGPDEVSISIDSEVDLERGDLLAASEVPIQHTDQFEADLVWLDEQEGVPGRSYVLRVGHSAVKATITRAFGIDSAGNKTGQIHQLPANSVTRANLETHEKLGVAAFADLADLGRMVLIDPETGNTVAAGVINHTLRRADNLVAHEFSVGIQDRAKLTGHQGQVAWFTGLSGSGKSTLANEVAILLQTAGIPHALLDGDTLRLGLNRDLGFTEADRVENIRRTAEVAKLMADSGLVVVVSLISPYRSDRAHAKDIIGPERFVEVFVDTPLEMCEQRDPKGLYQKARAGLIPNFTGIGAPYEAPEQPQIRVTPDISLADSARMVLDTLG